MKVKLLRAVALFTAAASLLVAGRPSAARPSRISGSDSVVALSRDAQGRSGALRTRMVMPGEKKMRRAIRRPEGGRIVMAGRRV